MKMKFPRISTADKVSSNSGAAFSLRISDLGVYKFSSFSLSPLPGAREMRNLDNFAPLGSYTVCALAVSLAVQLRERNLPSMRTRTAMILRAGDASI